MRAAFSVALAAIAALVAPNPASAQATGRVLLAAPTFSDRALEEDRALRRGGADPTGAVARRLRLQRAPLEDMEAVAHLSPDLPSALAQTLRRAAQDLGSSGRPFVGGTVTLTDGRSFDVFRRGDDLLVVPGGGDVGALPSVRGGEIGPVGVERLIRFGDVPMLNIGDAVGDVPSPENSDESSCGANNANPETHCALFTVRLRHESEGTFCTGVVVSDRHVLTAAHCVCDRILDGALDEKVFVTFGSGDTVRSWSFAEAAPNVFDRVHGGVCNAALPWEQRRGYGDLALLTLAPADPADGATPLAAIAARFIAAGADPAQARRLRAPLGEASADTWSADGVMLNVFATWGYGEGPDRRPGVKRGMAYPLQALSSCADDAGQADCATVQEAVFADAERGLCAGDSGSGVFKPIDAAASAEDRGLWAVMGLVSGYASPADCFNPDGGLLARQYPRNVVRLDTALVRGWLASAIGDGLDLVATRMDFDIRFAEADR